MAAVTRFLAAAILSVLIASAGESTAWAQQDQEDFRQGRVGVLDVAEIRRTAKMAVDMDRQISEKRQQFSEEVKVKEEQLRRDAEELEKQRVVLSPEAFQKKQDELRTRAQELQRSNQELRKRLDGMRAEAVKTFQKELNATVFKYANEENFVLILGRHELVFFRPALNITKEILKRLDERISSVKLPDPPLTQEK